jgi:uncharacterized DUF497 family protein
MTRLPPLLLLASLAGVARLGLACVGHDLNAGTGPDAGGPDGMGGTGGGPTVIASLIQLAPYNLVSDGTSLFWDTAMGSGGPIWSMPVGGGSITTVVPGLIGGGFLAVDDVNVYWQAQGGIYRAPKGGGGSPTLVNGPGPSIAGITSLGNKAYWVEQASGPTTARIAVKSVPLQGGPIGLIADAKAAANLRKHGVSFIEAATIFDDVDLLVDADPLAPERFIAVGFSTAARVLVVVHASRSERTRLISARRATLREEQLYAERSGR